MPLYICRCRRKCRMQRRHSPLLTAFTFAALAVHCPRPLLPVGLGRRLLQRQEQLVCRLGQGESSHNHRVFPFRNPPRLMAPPVIYCAQDGECSGANSEYLAVLCPHSCGTCTLTCEDTDVSCSAWAKNGDCTTNAGFMLKACPTSCGLCTPACKDVHEDCAGWTSAGACAENPDVSNMHKRAQLHHRTCFAQLHRRIRAQKPLSPRTVFNSHVAVYAQALPGLVRRVP